MSFSSKPTHRVVLHHPLKYRRGVFAAVSKHLDALFVRGRDFRDLLLHPQGLLFALFGGEAARRRES